MIHSRPSKLRVYLVTLIFSAVMVLAQPRLAQAFGDPITTFLALAYGGVLTIASVVCVPMAATGDKSFGRGYADCFLPFWSPDYEADEDFPEPTPTLDDEDLPEPTPTLVDEQIHPNEKNKEIALVETKAEIKAKAKKETGVDVPNELAEEKDEGRYRDRD